MSNYAEGSHRECETRVKNSGKTCRFCLRDQFPARRKERKSVYRDAGEKPFSL